MRIAFDAKRLFNNFTGLGNHSRTTLDILTEFFPESEYLLLTPKIRENAVTQPYLQHEGCSLVMPKGPFRSFSPCGALWRTFSLAKVAAEHGATVFHGLSNELPTGLKQHGLRSVVTIHDVAFRTFPDMYHWHDRQIYDLKWRYACRHADHIIAISESTRQDVLRFYGVPEERVSVVYQPVQRLFYTPQSEPRLVAEQAVEGLPQDYLLYVGSVNSRKNLLGIVRALEQLPQDVRLPLVVVGNGGEYKQKVLEYVVAHHLEQHLIWAGSIIDNRQLQALYQCAALFVYPSFYEGFGLPVVEALLSGCPVVTSNVSSLPEAGGPHSLQADPTSVESIADCLFRLLTDTDLRQRAIVEGQAYARRTFDPPTLARQLHSIYLS
jgi:glycosyltransferase involved in cell wall biosynthesis